MSADTQKTLVGCFFVAIFGLMIPLYLSNSVETFRNCLFLIPPFLAFVGGIYVTRTYHISNIHGAAMGLITAGMLCFFIAECLFLAFQHIFHIDPYPSVADVFYLAAYPLILAGLLKELGAGKSKLQQKNKLVFALMILLLLCFTIMILYFGVYQAYDATESFLNNAVAIFYGIGDLILIIPTLFVLKLALDYSGGKQFNAWMMLLIAIILMMAADVLYAIFKDHYNLAEAPYIMIDLLWASSYLLFGYSFIYTALTIRESRSKLLKAK